MYFADDDLVRAGADLEARLAERTSWYEPPRLYGHAPSGVSRHDHQAGPPWIRLAEGDPYQFLDRILITADDVAAVALATCGWSFPADLEPRQWSGRPSQHPRRVRVRTVVLVTPDRRQCSVIRRRGRESLNDDVKIIDHGGEGPLLRALQAVWSPPAA